MDEIFSMLEPSWKPKESRLETYWSSFNDAYSLTTERIKHFDPIAGMSLSPVRYIISNIIISEEKPSDEWIKEQFISFVRGEISINNEPFPSNWPPIIDDDITISEHFLMEYLSKSEWHNLIDPGELTESFSDYEMAENIYELLCNDKIGSKQNRKNNDKQAFIDKILPVIEKKTRLLFVVPSCPFKDQNRFRVPDAANNADFSEISFLIKLHNIIQGLYQIHPYGAEFIILSDGNLYGSIFDIDNNDVNEYMERLLSFRNKLNIQLDVSVIDLKEMIDRADKDYVIYTIKEKIFSYINNYLKETESFHILKQGMKWNINTNKTSSQFSHVPDDIMWKILKCEKTDIPLKYRHEWEQMDGMADDAALQYAAINLTLKWTNLISLYFPEAIRCTVHPKKDQFAISLGYAWNGIAWSKRWPESIVDIDTESYYRINELSNKIYRIHFNNELNACAYVGELSNKNIILAQSVLPHSGWNYNDFFGREFDSYDVEEFTELGINDENYSWEKRIMPPDYYRNLLQFRLNHYHKYGFGVHGVWMDGKLIGQIGLQVLDEENNQLEIVLFLGKEYTHKGYGSQLINYLLDRCKKTGIKTVYGVSRQSNKVALKILKKMKAKPIRNIRHYKEDAVLYEIIV